MVITKTVSVKEVHETPRLTMSDSVWNRKQIGCECSEAQTFERAQPGEAEADGENLSDVGGDGRGAGVT